LNDRERYWGLTWPGWVAAVAAIGLLYGAIKLSPFGFKPTVTIAALLIALLATVLLGVAGQALSPGRQLLAIAHYRRSPKQWTLATEPDKHGLVLAAAPQLELDDAEDRAVVGSVDETWDVACAAPDELRDGDAERVLN
jgi:hypothetical protein